MEASYPIPAQDQQLLKKIYQFSRTKKASLYLVGGYVRDILLKRKQENPDIDFCILRGALRFGRALAGELKSGFVVLDKEHGCCRLVKKVEDRTYTLDFTDFRGKALADDLLHRDFTINTLAVALQQAITQRFKEDNIIDLYAGRKDLKSKLIRLAHADAFDEDALRIVRAFSLACVLDFKIDKKTLALIRKKRAKLTDISQERIRDELFRILDTKDCHRYLAMMDGFGVLQIIFPEIKAMRNLRQGPYHHLDVWKHTLETIKQLEGLMKELKNGAPPGLKARRSCGAESRLPTILSERRDKKNIRNYLNEEISSNRRRAALMKLGAFLHDIGKPAALRHEDGKTKFHGHERIGLNMTEEIARRLRLSNNEVEALKRMVLWHLRPGYLADIEDITPRAIFRYFRDTADEALSILLLSVADQRATRGPLTSRATRLQHEQVAFGLIGEYFKRKKQKKLVRLITGDDLIEKFKLEPSPLIGKILREIEELQAIGKITTRKKALQAAGVLCA